MLPSLVPAFGVLPGCSPQLLQDPSPETLSASPRCWRGFSLSSGPVSKCVCVLRCSRHFGYRYGRGHVSLTHSKCPHRLHLPPPHSRYAARGSARPVSLRGTEDSLAWRVLYTHSLTWTPAHLPRGSRPFYTGSRALWMAWARPGGCRSVLLGAICFQKVTKL